MRDVGGDAVQLVLQVVVRGTALQLHQLAELEQDFLLLNPCWPIPSRLLLASIKL